MAGYDNKAFNTMKKATLGSSDRMFEEGPLFTESEYNTRATHSERLAYDESAFKVLEELYKEEGEKGRIEKLNFQEFLGSLDNKYLEEKFLEFREDDPSYYAEGGKLLEDIFEYDPEQLKLSAHNFYMANRSQYKGPRSRIERSNISTKAPGAERY